MSYILDALKKLEHEKSRKSRGNGMINISGALFEKEGPKPSGTAGWKIALAVTVAVLVTFTVTWQFLQSGQGRGNPSRPLATQVPPVTIKSAPAPPVPPVVSVQQPSPAASPAPAEVTTVRPPAGSSKIQKEGVRAATVTEDTASLLTMQELRKRTNERQGQALPADQTIEAPADIQLSGIAWQEERRARRVVVNGFLMREGGVVSGAKITDIFQDRVRFSLSGKIFEIPLISSAVSAAGK